MEWLKINTFLEVSLEVPYASSWKRYFAFFLDTVIKFSLGFALYQSYESGLISIELCLLLGSPILVYTLLWEYFAKGQSPGKWVMKISVVGQDGAPPSFSQCFVRWIFLSMDAYSTLLLYFVSPWMLVLVAFGPAVAVARIERSQQRYGDLAAGTYVVESSPDFPTVEDTIYSFSSVDQDSSVQYPEVIRFSDRDMTRVKEVLESKNPEMQARLSQKIQELLGVQAVGGEEKFLKQLLQDYNKLSLQ